MHSISLVGYIHEVKNEEILSILQKIELLLVKLFGDLENAKNSALWFKYNSLKCTMLNRNKDIAGAKQLIDEEAKVYETLGVYEFKILEMKSERFDKMIKLDQKLLSYDDLMKLKKE